MPVSVAQFQPNYRGSMGAIAEGISALSQMGLIGPEHEKYKAMQASNAQTAEKTDMDSPVSETARQENLAAIDFAKKGGYINPERASALQSAVLDSNAADLEKNPELSPILGLIKGQQQATAMGNMAALRAAPMMERVTEQKNQNSIEAGSKFDTDPIIQLSTTNQNALKRSMSILTNPDKPVTTKDMNLAYNDYINAVAAGGTATEGKIQRELPETFASQFNSLKGKFGEFDDMRQNPTGAQLIDMLSKNIGTVNGDIQQAVSNRAANLYSNYAASSNPKVQQIAAAKLKQYAPQTAQQIFGGGSDNSSPSASASQGNSGPSNAPASAPDTSGDMVSVISPEGKVGRIPKANLGIATQRGFKVNGQ